ncbi:hypothetical protein QBC34DRAFT_399377 [Podospora aff. communis PSN243]|uniref:Ecp2 effector protein domain-containing protein n=1 Tax=Podospora aff. communis PSN243 TaxID=3040156 RepID=A0AAV9GZX3_9PEZI|nr:hypothetical protein QBC34DRAFT_399377 [Podospora aff. communis PSN243]
MFFARHISAVVLCILALGISLASGANIPAPPALTLWSEKGFKGERGELSYSKAQSRECYDIPDHLKVKSVRIKGPKCCILYRAKCPRIGYSTFAQIPLFFNQRIYADVADLEPLGFSDIVRSVVCPHQDVCSGILVDREYYGKEDWNMRGYWVDMRSIELKEIEESEE